MAGPRLLLFGMPGAGKSSLLGAIAQAAPNLVDASGGLERLQKNTYAASLQPTAGLESYQIRRQPTDKAPATEVTVIDCSGKSALEMMEAKTPFADSHPLKKPILDADGVILAVDVSLTGKQLNEQFRQFAHWVKQLHQIRGQRTEIADLPVYFVLTKCDLLAKKDDTAGAWIKRIEEVKSTFDENLRKYLRSNSDGFGTIKLKLNATAIKRPAFTDRPAKAQEPFGVAELFGECMRSANDFQERRQTSQSRLQNVVVGLAGLIAVLGLSVFFLVEFQPKPRGTTLDEKVHSVLPKSDATALARLQGTTKKLKDRESKLIEIESDGDFARLPSDTREAVTAYREELAKYLQLDQESQSALKLPHLAKNDAELKEQEKTVQGYALPTAHSDDWADTRLGKRLRKVSNEYANLHAALKDEDAWIQGQIDENRKLLKAGNRLYGKLLDQDKDAAQEAKDWHRQYVTQLTARPATPRDDNVPGVSQLLYEDLARFEPVKTAHKNWKMSKDDLVNISELIQKKLRAG